MSKLKGTDALRARVKAMRLAFKPIGRDWADETARAMASNVPVRTGRLRRSFRRKSATQRKATVAGHYTAFFVDKGPVAHLITAKKRSLVFPVGGNTIFARQVHHRGYRARPFRQRSAEEGVRRANGIDEMIKKWNGAA